VTAKVLQVIAARDLTAYGVAKAAGLKTAILTRFLSGERTLSGDSTTTG
jgi:hypothetical protein